MAEIDKKKPLKKLPSLTLFLIVASFLAVTTFISGILIPQYLKIKKVKNERISKTLQLEEQKKLFPVYARTQALAKVKFDPKLPFRERTALNREKISTLSAVFNDIALKHNMVLDQNSLDIRSLQNTSSSVSMDVQFSGNLFDYRNCLISLAALPFFQGIEKIKITKDQKNIKKFSTKLLILLDKK